MSNRLPLGTAETDSVLDRVGRLIKFDELEVLAHFKVEVEKDNLSKKQTERRIATSRNLEDD